MSEKITGEEYKKIYVPVGAWVLIEKDLLPEKTAGGIILPTRGRESHTKVTTTGTIVALSPNKEFETNWDAYLRSIYRVGDRVGFSDTTPILSPAPPNMAFAEDCDQRFVTMHISDILMVFCDTEEKKKEFSGRF
jgi:co-chaperonin GroES (HSP10)